MTVVTLGLIAVTSEIAYRRYGNANLSQIPLITEPAPEQDWAGETIHFQHLEGHQFNVAFTLTDGDTETQLQLRNIDLSLMIPTVPTMAQGNATLTQWFLTEREFNRQRVIFDAGSPHIYLPNGFAGYPTEELSIALTNNCLGAGHWEVAVYAQTADGNSETVYQGYFTFPRRGYAALVNQLNPTQYWHQARTMEAWPGFQFLSGRSLDLSTLRTVEQAQPVPVTDLKTEPILATTEQRAKANLMVTADGATPNPETWADLRQADLRFHSFVTPGVYDPSRLWNSDYSRLDQVTGAIARQINSPLSEQDLVEIQLNFRGTHGKTTHLIVSGIDLSQVPQLNPQDYAEGIYMPLGFGTPFTQTYSELAQNPPADNPLMSMVLDGENRVVDYRQEIGLNGLVIHRDAQDANLLHLYPMSYERITLVGHYVIDLSAVPLIE